MSNDKRMKADPGREQEAIRLFSTALTPEEYAARNAHLWACFSFDDFRYSDTKLDNWIQRLGDILFQRPGAPNLNELRERYLSVEERELIRRKEEEEF